MSVVGCADDPMPQSYWLVSEFRHSQRRANQPTDSATIPLQGRLDQPGAITSIASVRSVVMHVAWLTGVYALGQLIFGRVSPYW
jgi:hypothetical protein